MGLSKAAFHYVNAFQPLPSFKSECMTHSYIRKTWLCDLESWSGNVKHRDHLQTLINPVLSFFFFFIPQRGTVDTEIKVPLCLQPRSAKGSPFQAWRKSKYSFVCFAYFQEFCLHHFYLCQFETILSKHQETIICSFFFACVAGRAWLGLRWSSKVWDQASTSLWPVFISCHRWVAVISHRFSKGRGQGSPMTSVCCHTNIVYYRYFHQ